MPLVDQVLLGIVILVLLGALVLIKQISTGSVLDKPRGSLLVQLVNIFNLFFLLIVNPLAALAVLTNPAAVISSDRTSWAGILLPRRAASRSP